MAVDDLNLLRFKIIKIYSRNRGRKTNKRKVIPRNVFRLACEKGYITAGGP